MDEPWNISKAKLIVAIVGVTISAISAYLVVANGDHYFPFFPAASSLPAGSSSLPGGYRHTWHGQIPGTSFHLVLKLGSGGINEAVGSISSPELGCAAVVYLQKAGSPAILKLDTSDSSLECELLSLFDSASISLISGDSLRFTIDMLAGPESVDLSL